MRLINLYFLLFSAQTLTDVKVNRRQNVKKKYIFVFKIINIKLSSKCQK
jgi:hypothetical protein